MNAKPCNCLDQFSHCDMSHGCMNEPQASLHIRETNEVVTDGVSMKISELTGPQLDYWVARAEGYHGILVDSEECRICPEGVSAPYASIYAPSLNWATGGPIIEREQISVIRFECSDVWEAVALSEPIVATGQTSLEAAMRCFVTCKFGDEVSDENV